MTKFRGSVVEINSSFFKQLDDLAADCRNDAKKVNWAIDKAMMGYAMVTLGYAQKYSRGPLDPSQNRGGQASPIVHTGVSGGRRSMFTARRFYGEAVAWKIPVRRITNVYYLSWYVKRLRLGTWSTGNNSREAWFIEMGINHPSTGLRDSAGQLVRVRRPVMKMSTVKAVQFGVETKFALREFTNYFHTSLRFSSNYELFPHTPSTFSEVPSTGQFVFGRANA